jgi:hypothetical protein
LFICKEILFSYVAFSSFFYKLTGSLSQEKKNKRFLKFLISAGQRVIRIKVSDNLIPDLFICFFIIGPKTGVRRG